MIDQRILTEYQQWFGTSSSHGSVSMGIGGLGTTGAPRFELDTADLAQREEPTAVGFVCRRRKEPGDDSRFR
jgi:hypothetical protein